MVTFPRIGRTESWLKKLWKSEDQHCHLKNNGSPQKPTVAGLWFGPRLGKRVGSSIQDGNDYSTYPNIPK